MSDQTITPGTLAEKLQQQFCFITADDLPKVVKLIPNADLLFRLTPPGKRRLIRAKDAAAFIHETENLGNPEGDAIRDISLGIRALAALEFCESNYEAMGGDIRDIQLT